MRETNAYAYESQEKAFNLVILCKVKVLILAISFGRDIEGNRIKMCNTFLIPSVQWSLTLLYMVTYSVFIQGVRDS